MITTVVVLALLMGAILLWLLWHPEKTTFDHDTELEHDTDWISIPDVEDIRSDWDELAAADVLAVDETMLGEAIEMLETRPAVALTPDQLQRLTGRDHVKILSDAKPYLVRAVRLQNTHGKFEVRRKDGMLWVRYGCLARSPKRVVKHVLVVMLNEPPVQLFVDGVMAQ